MPCCDLPLAVHAAGIDSDSESHRAVFSTKSVVPAAGCQAANKAHSLAAGTESLKHAPSLHCQCHWQWQSTHFAHAADAMRSMARGVQHWQAHPEKVLQQVLGTVFGREQSTRQTEKPWDGLHRFPQLPSDTIITGTLPHWHWQTVQTGATVLVTTPATGTPPPPPVPCLPH